MPYRKRGRGPALLVAAGLTLAACGSVEASEPAGPSRPPGTAEVSAPAQESPSAGQGTPTDQAEQAEQVRLTVTGGIAGVHRSILASTDGTVEISDRSEGTREADPLSGAERARLKDLLVEVDFARLPARSVNEGARDMFRYALEHDGHVVVTDRSVPLGTADDLIAHLERHLEERL